MNDQDLREWIRHHFKVTPKDLSIYRIALTLRQGEVLEHFGDSVLGFIVSEYLFENYSIDEPGWFTHVRSSLVENEHLTRIGKRINLAQAVILPKTSSKEHVTDRVLADRLEALIAAVYRDQGLKKCKEVVRTVFELSKEKIEKWNDTQQNITSNPLIQRQRLEERVMAELLATLEDKNSISALQEFLAKKGESPPEYTEIERTGVSHRPEFTLEATCKFRGRSLVAEGKGTSIKEARKHAAHALLHKVIELYKNGWG
jgi:ribonuclease-3